MAMKEEVKYSDGHFRMKCFLTFSISCFYAVLLVAIKAFCSDCGIIFSLIIANFAK